MKFYFAIILLAVVATMLVGCREDPWEEIRPYFGGKPEESLQICKTSAEECGSACKDNC
jgi:hypothetical protein